MNWIDYREKLGIGFSKTDKLVHCLNRLENQLLGLKEDYNENSLFHYANIIGESYQAYYEDIDPISNVICSIRKVKSIEELLYKYMALINSLDYDNNDVLQGRLEKYLISALKGTLNQNGPGKKRIK